MNRTVNRALTAPARRPASGRWLSTWTAAPLRADPPDLPPPPFTADGLVLADCTLRQTIKVSAGGRRIRLRISNAYGDTDLTLTRVCVAVPSGGQAGAKSITAGSSRAATFGGRLAAVVPAGAQMVSDPLDFPVAAGGNVTVSVYLAAGQPADGVTSHPGSRTTSYLMAGNHVDDENPAMAADIDHWYFLSGAEVWSGSASAAAVVVLGDSLTDGRGSTTNGNDRWPDQLFARLRSRRDTAAIAVLNQGIGGNRVLRDGAGPSVMARLDRDALAFGGVRWLVVFAGLNDIGTADPTDGACKQVAADLITAYEQIVLMAHARGIRAYGATLTPFGGGEPYDDAAGHREAARQAVNEWIRASRGFDAILDFDEAVRDPRSPGRLRPSLDTGDHLHLNPAGYLALSSAVPFGLFRTDGRGAR